MRRKVLLVAAALVLLLVADVRPSASAQSPSQTLLFTLDTLNLQEHAYFGLSLAMGDVDGDGKGDIAVGAFREDVGGNDWEGWAYVFSGADGSLLFTLETSNPQERACFGYPLAVGDVDGDGKGDKPAGLNLARKDLATGGSYTISRPFTLAERGDEATPAVLR